MTWRTLMGTGSDHMPCQVVAEGDEREGAGPTYPRRPGQEARPDGVHAGRGYDAGLLERPQPVLAHGPEGAGEPPGHGEGKPGLRTGQGGGVQQVRKGGPEEGLGGTARGEPD